MPKATKQLTLDGKEVSKPAKTDGKDKLKTDVIIGIKPEFVEMIVERTKNHEFRKYEMKEAKRLWFYESMPTSALTYVAVVDPAKTPGQIKDQLGVGNKDFNEGKKQSKFGYPIKELYRFQNPITLDEMRSKFRISVPQGRMFVKRDLADAYKLDDMERVF